MLSKKEYSKLKKDVETIIINHSNGDYVLDFNFEIEKIYTDYYDMCVVWYFYINQLIKLDDFETCVLIRNIISEEKQEVIIKMHLAGIYEKETDDYLDKLEQLAREKQEDNYANGEDEE